jgi:hypothetical protein
VTATFQVGQRVSGFVEGEDPINDWPQLLLADGSVHLLKRFARAGGCMDSVIGERIIKRRQKRRAPRLRREHDPGRAFGPKEAVARAGCVVAEAEDSTRLA